MQLCVARNRRRCSAVRYRGVAQVTSRRARKGFQLRYNPDAHWSSALYRNLQYTDGNNIINMNWDDASGFRLDTLATHRLHRTDYVNSYPSILQTTNYNFSATSNTGEICAGIVKASALYPKNAAQHAADLSMLENKESVKAAFMHPLDEQAKMIDCIGVDGAMDEGPGHMEVQFWWTLRHYERPTIATIVTTRNSGASYLNRVELQNGCLALAHANLFIPSNLNGSCFNPETGKLDQERLQRNMGQATVSRCNGAPCGDARINLFKGADSAANQELRKDILIYLKGTKSEKQSLRQRKDKWEFIDKIWQMRNRHMVSDLPAQYVLFLRCCMAADCVHPLCQQNMEIPQWFPGGPIPDPAYPWGSTDCCKCQGKVCYGHFLAPELSSLSSLSPMSKPPSSILKDSFNNFKDRDMTEADRKKLPQAALLPPEEIDMWFEHRKRGAAKAAATRQLKKSKEQRFFCICGEEYLSLTDEVQNWIGCDACSHWFHFECVGINPDSLPERFVCSQCSS